MFLKLSLLTSTFEVLRKCCFKGSGHHHCHHKQTKTQLYSQESPMFYYFSLIGVEMLKPICIGVPSEWYLSSVSLYYLKVAGPYIHMGTKSLHVWLFSVTLLKYFIYVLHDLESWRFIEQVWLFWAFLVFNVTYITLWSFIFLRCLFMGWWHNFFQLIHFD